MEKTRRSPSEKTPREKLLLAFEKACLKAAEARAANKELRQNYRDNREKRAKVRDLLIQDLLRVFNHPDNPYAGWAASRKRYRELGHYPEILVADLFGTHAEFERAAGLRDARGTSKVRLLTARLSTEKQIREYAEESVMGSVGRWRPAYSQKDGVKHVVVGSDFHGQMVDPFALRVWLAVLKIVAPDLVVFNGDVVDFPTVGRFSQIPGAGSLSLQYEIDFVRHHIFAPTREVVGPKTPMTYHIGNHEHRLIRYLADTAPELADLRCLRWDALFGIDDFNIEMVFGGNWLAPRQKDRSENVGKTFKVYYDTFVVSHGRSIAANAMAEELKRFGLSGTSGHTHRPGVWTAPTLANPGLSWTSTGMMAGFAVGKDYVDGPSGWTMGCAVFTIDPVAGLVVPQPIMIYEEFATFAGHVFRPTEEERAIRRKMWGENGNVTASKR
jgi:predicted phosphodiesterase